MKYFKLIGITALLIAVMCSSSCVDEFKVGNDFLEKEPGADVDINKIFGEAELARRFLWNTYSGLYYGLPWDWNAVANKMNMGVFEALSDCWHSHLSWDRVNLLYYSGSYSAGSEETSHTKFGYTQEGCWETIRKGWVFIENVERVPDMDAAEKTRLAAEARLIIATRYFDMFRHFGGLPIVDHAWGSTENTNNERVTAELTVNFILKLLDDAAADLPWALEPEEISNWDGRMTRAAAMGLKCKVLLFAASPLFNDKEPYCTEEPQIAVQKRQVWYGGYDAKWWEACLDACEKFFAEVTDKGRYDLYRGGANHRTSFRNAYSLRGSGGDNPEMLISTRIRYSYSNEWDGAFYFPQASMYGAMTPTQEFVEMFPMSDGTPFNWDNPDHVKRMFTDRDPRLYETIVVEGSEYQGRQIELWVGGREIKQGSVTESGQFATGYGNYKYLLDIRSSKNKPLLWPYLRMAEIYLIYAEALMMDNQHGLAVSMVDQVRDRVGLKGLAECNPTLDLNDTKVLLKEILRERACELGLEDVRFFDLIRHKMADDFKKPLHGIQTRRADGKEDSWSDKPAASRGERPTEFAYQTFELKNQTRSWWKQGGFSPKWYLSAFPPSEVNKNYGLTQNPGW